MVDYYTLPVEGGSYTFDELVEKYLANDIGYKDLPAVVSVLNDSPYSCLVQ